MHGNLVYYRMGLVNRYGDEYVKDLERKNKRVTKKWDRFELEDIINQYKIKK